MSRFYASSSDTSLNRNMSSLSVNESENEDDILYSDNDEEEALREAKRRRRSNGRKSTDVLPKNKNRNNGGSNEDEQPTRKFKKLSLPEEQDSLYKETRNIMSKRARFEVKLRFLSKYQTANIIPPSCRLSHRGIPSGIDDANVVAQWSDTVKSAQQKLREIYTSFVNNTHDELKTKEASLRDRVNNFIPEPNLTKVKQALDKIEARVSKAEYLEHKEKWTRDLNGSTASRKAPPPQKKRKRDGPGQNSQTRNYVEDGEQPSTSGQAKRKRRVAKATRRLDQEKKGKNAQSPLELLMDLIKKSVNQ